MTEELKYSHLLIFVPEGRRESTEAPLDLQDRWVMKLLGFCSELFGGATAYGRGVGVWRSPGRGRNARSAKTHWDRVTVIECWVNPAIPKLDRKMDRLGRVLEKMRQELREKEVGYYS